MLLVKSRESKNSGSQTALFSRAYASLLALVFTSFSTQAQSSNATDAASIASIFLSLLLVVAIIFVLAYLMRRFNVTQTGSSQLKVVASMMAGTRERVVVIEVGDEQHLLGITSHNINHLAKLAQPLETTRSTPNSGEHFKDKLTQALAGKISGAMGKRDDC